MTSTLSPLAGKNSLYRLEINANPIEDIALLADFRSLCSLSMYKCLVRDITPLLDLPRLEYLSLSKCKIPNLSLEQARKLKKIRSVDIGGNPLRNIPAPFRNLNFADILAYLESL